MKYRTVVLEDNLDISTAATKTWDLNLNDPISRLSFKFNIQNHATTPVIVAHPARAVTKVEIIDGSHMIASISGEQLLSMNYYDNKRMPQSYINGVTATQSYFTACLDFGRWLWDTELAFDPKRYNNPQIRITYNKALYETSAAYMYLTMWADVFDEKAPSPRGYLKRHEITTWTPANSTKTRLDLPIDFPYRALFATGYSTTDTVKAAIEQLKISEDTDKKVPIDINTKYLAGQIMGDYPPILETVVHVGATGTETLYTMASNEGKFVGLSTTQEIVFLTSYTADTLVVDCQTGSNRIEGTSTGYIPFHTLPLYFGDRNDLGDWYDPITAAIKKLELIATGSSSVGTSPVGRICLEQLVPF